HEALAALGLPTAPALDEVMNVGEFYIIGAEGCVRVLLPAHLADQLTSRLVDQSVPLLSEETRELIRIEAGRAGAPEFTDAYTPFEVGLERYVSDSKGCYTG